MQPHSKHLERDHHFQRGPRDTNRKRYEWLALFDVDTEKDPEIGPIFCLRCNKRVFGRSLWHIHRSQRCVSLKANLADTRRAVKDAFIGYAPTGVDDHIILQPSHGLGLLEMQEPSESISELCSHPFRPLDSWDYSYTFGGKIVDSPHFQDQSDLFHPEPKQDAPDEATIDLQDFVVTTEHDTSGYRVEGQSDQGQHNGMPTEPNM